jgi:hypothetical protein
MQRLFSIAFAISALIASSGAAAETNAEPGYARDVISVVTLGRHSAFPTATCLVWANAESHGVGPQQLHGFHGLNLQINLHPLPNELGQHPTTFADGMAALKGQFPDAPAWILSALERNRPKIEAACDQDHPQPYVVYKVTRREGP